MSWTPNKRKWSQLLQAILPHVSAGLENIGRGCLIAQIVYLSTPAQGVWNATPSSLVSVTFPISVPSTVRGGRVQGYSPTPTCINISFVLSQFRNILFWRDHSTVWLAQDCSWLPEPLVLHVSPGVCVGGGLWLYFVCWGCASLKGMFFTAFVWEGRCFQPNSLARVVFWSWFDTEILEGL